MDCGGQTARSCEGRGVVRKKMTVSRLPWWRGIGGVVRVEAGFWFSETTGDATPERMAACPCRGGGHCGLRGVRPSGSSSGWVVDGWDCRDLVVVAGCGWLP